MKLLGAAGAIAMSVGSLGAQSTAALRLTLSQAEQLALANSDALRVQRLKNESAAERVRLSVRAYLPQIQLGLTTGSTVNVGAQDSGTDELSLTVKQPLYDGGRTHMQRELSVLQLTLNRHTYRVARESLLSAVYAEFYQVLVLQAQRKVKEETLANTRRQLKIARAELKIGMVTEIDVLDTELSVSNQEIDLQSTESDLENATYSLQKSLSLSPDQPVALEGTIDSGYNGVAIRWKPQRFLSLAESHNLNLQNARYQVRKQQVQVRVARSEYLPQVSASVGITVSGQNFPLQTPGATFGLDISFPQPSAPVQASVSGGQSGATSANQNSSFTINPLQSITGGLDRADAENALEQARSQEKTLLRDLSFQIRQAISQYRRQQETIRLERQSVRLEHRKLAIMKQQLANGSTTYVDYLTEQATAENDQVQLLSDILALIKDERSLESLAGIAPGSLAALQGESSASP